MAGTSGTSTTIGHAPAALASAPGSIASANSSRGICSLTTNSGNSFRFRTNPNAIRWKYMLNTHIDDTYGGRVIQILSARIDTLSVVVETGWGGWDYMVKAAYFLRDFMNEQRNGKPGRFVYTTRNWDLQVFAVSIPFADTAGKPNHEVTMTFNVVEDNNSQLAGSTIGTELARLQEGIGWGRSAYNSAEPPTDGTEGANLGAISNTIQSVLGGIQDPTSQLQNLFGNLGGLG